MTKDETISWLQFMIDTGCPKCKQKEDFRITVYTPIDKDRNFLSVNELTNMKDGSYIILCDKCDYYTRDIKTLM